MRLQDLTKITPRHPSTAPDRLQVLIVAGGETVSAVDFLTRRRRMRATTRPTHRLRHLLPPIRLSPIIRACQRKKVALLGVIVTFMLRMRIPPLDSRDTH